MRSKARSKVHAGETFEMARSYQIAANRLLTAMRAEQLPLMDPTYFLYAHTVELALKALLQAQGISVTGSHDIGDLFEDCRSKDLIGPDPHFELHNLVVLLGAGNEGHRYRYAGNVRRIRPDLPWVQEAVERLMKIVQPHINDWIRDNSPPAPKRYTVFGKPIVKKQPKPTK